MNRLVFSYGFLSSRLLIQILRTCTTLQTLEFNATEGFTLDQTLAIFQKRHVDFWIFEQGSGADTPKAPPQLLTATDLVPWTCQGLESLSLGGLHQDLVANNVSDEWMIPATLPAHHWIAKGSTKIELKLRTLILCHIQQLPKLKSLRLNGIAFAYSEVPAEKM
ncbi:hypothetical protein BG000_008535 [Podila horticola]|nr:hypothetical protein BG000_008535 [Podila horticola]